MIEIGKQNLKLMMYLSIKVYGYQRRYCEYIACKNALLSQEESLATCQRKSALS